MSTGAYTSITAGVSDVDAALRLFRDTLGLRVEYDVEAGADLVEAWRLAPGTRLRLLELSYDGYPAGRLRLASYDPPATVRARDDHGGPDSPLDIGPKAIDFYVHGDMAATVAGLQEAGFPARSQPVRHRIGHIESEELLLTGPDGLPVLLMIGHSHTAASMRPPKPGQRYSEIATTSIVCGDLDTNRRFYGGLLGLETGTDAATPDEYRDLVDDLVGAPRGTPIHFLLYQQAGEPSGKILLVHFFDASPGRLVDRSRPGNLGLSLFSYPTDDLDGLRRAVEEFGPGAALLTPPVEVQFGPEQRRIMLVRGPNEETIELYETLAPERSPQ